MTGPAEVPWWKAPWVRGLVSALAVGLAPLLCGLIPNAVGSSVCSVAVRVLAGAVESSQPTPGSTLPPHLGDLPSCPDSLCLSVGPHLPMPDGGDCACPL